MISHLVDTIRYFNSLILYLVGTFLYVNISTVFRKIRKIHDLISMIRYLLHLRKRTKPTKTDDDEKP